MVHDYSVPDTPGFYLYEWGLGGGGGGGGGGDGVGLEGIWKERTSFFFLKILFFTDDS